MPGLDTPKAVMFVLAGIAAMLMTAPLLLASIREVAREYRTDHHDGKLERLCMISIGVGASMFLALVLAVGVLLFVAGVHGLMG